MQGLVLAVMLAIATLTPAHAQSWPSKPVRIVSPFAPGGGSDTLGRIISEDISAKLGQQFVIENRGGAGGMIGTAAVAASPPDGYTFVISSIATHVIAPLSSSNPGYDPIKNFTHVAYAGGPPIVIVAHPSLGVKTFKDLQALLRSHPEGTPYVSPGSGTLGNLLAEYWAEKDGIKLTHVAYKGSGQAINDLVAGHVQLGSITYTGARGQMQGGTIVPLAVSSARRMPEFPDVPTLKELGYPDLAVTTWFAFSAPAGLPTDIVQKMNAAVNNAMDVPLVRKRLTDEGFELEKMSPAEFTAFVQGELVKWGPLARRLTAEQPN